MKISNLFTGDWGKVKALFSIELNGVWIKGFKLIESNGELWVGFPSKKKDDKYEDTVIMNKERKSELTNLAMIEYNKQLESKDYHLR